MSRLTFLLVAITVAGCDERGSRPTCDDDGVTHEVGDVWPAGDGCNSCTCTESGAACTRLACLDGGVDANPASCEPSSGCPQGPACGTTCCGSGEKCVGGTCMCGSAPACGAGDSCAAAGPIGGDACGAICCGANGPCPQ